MNALLLVIPLSLGARAATESAVPAAAEIKIKLATLSPDGSVWDKAFRKMGDEWKRDTEGRVTLTIYPSGVAGDEPDIVRKIRIGQLHAAALSTSGLGDIDPLFSAFEIPMFFESHAEVLHVIAQMTEVIERRLAEKGFVLLCWAHAGQIHLFSTKPVSKPADLRNLKLFVWAGGGSDMIRWWRENGFQPVPLAATDVPTGLQTGLIEAVPAPPVTALAFQWFRSANYMLDLQAVPYIGAVVVSEKAWKRVSDADRALVLAAARRAEEHMGAEVPEQEERSVAEMKGRGLVVVPSEGGAEPWRPIAADFARKMRGDVIPADVFDEIQRHRDAYRRR